MRKLNLGQVKKLPQGHVVGWSAVEPGCDPSLFGSCTHLLNLPFSLPLEPLNSRQCDTDDLARSTGTFKELQSRGSSPCNPAVTAMLVVGACGWSRNLSLLVAGVPRSPCPTPTGCGLVRKGMQKLLKLGCLWGLFTGLRIVLGEILLILLDQALQNGQDFFLPPILQFTSFLCFTLHIPLCGCSGNIKERFQHYRFATYSLFFPTF